MDVSGISSANSGNYNGIQPDPVTDMGSLDFLNLLVTQLQNQDPLNPQDSAEFASQLAQFTSLEQMIQMNDSLQSVAHYQASMNNMSSISLIGKEVTVADGNMILKTNGQCGAVNYVLEEDMAHLQVKVTDENGEVIYTSPDQGPLAVGNHSFVWDGRNDAGETMPDGKYNYQLVATDYNEEQQRINTTNTYLVDGVQFINGVTYLDIRGTLLPLGDVIAVSTPEQPLSASSVAPGGQAEPAEHEDGKPELDDQ